MKTTIFISLLVILTAYVYSKASGLIPLEGTMSFSVGVHTNRVPFSVGYDSRRVFLSSDTGLQFIFLSDHAGEVNFKLNGAVLTTSEIEAREELVYPTMDTTIPVSALNSINERSTLEFEFVPSDDAARHAERVYSTMTLVYAPNDFEPEILTELEPLLDLKGTPRRSYWIKTRMGVIHQGVRSRTVHLGRWFGNMFIPRSSEATTDASASAFYRLIREKALEQETFARMDKLR